LVGHGQMIFLFIYKYQMEKREQHIVIQQ